MDIEKASARSDAKWDRTYSKKCRTNLKGTTKYQLFKFVSIPTNHYLNIIYIYKGNFLFQLYSLKISFFNNRQSPYLTHWVSYLQSSLQNAWREPWFESCWVCWNNLQKLYEIIYSTKDIKQFISTNKTITE